MNLVWLAADQPDEGDRTASEAMDSWSHQGFHRQHYNHVLARIQTELYRGRADAAWDLVHRQLAGIPSHAAAQHSFREGWNAVLARAVALLMAASRTPQT
jgi:hypothetical protein